MSKLKVTKLDNGNVWCDGVEYAKVDYPIQKGDIVKALESDCDITEDAFYEVDNIHNGNFTFYDNVGDDRDRSIYDDEFVPYRKVTSQPVGIHPQTIVIEHPVRLILKGDVTIEIQGGITLA
jgi:hypothetical protein